MSTPAAVSALAPAVDPAANELVRAARRRVASSRLESARRRIFAVSGAVVGLAAAVCAFALHGGPPFRWTTALVFCASYALVSRVRFETGSGSAIPTQLVLVPMLFALPIGLVPATVATGFVLGLGWRRSTLTDPSRLLPLVANAVHAFGPALVVATAGGLPLRWSAWPVYLAALGAQLVLDLANAMGSDLGGEIDLRTLLGFAGIAYAVDAALAPIALLVAFATRTHPELVVLVLPLVVLLRHFSRERTRRIDHALELSDAYRGTAFLLGDVVEADDAYTGSHSRHVVDLVLGVCGELGLDAASRRDAEFVALLHDVGKIRIPAEIINKPGALTPEERAVIETHTVEGERLLEQVGGLLGHIGRVVRSCHEHWDGGGYPDRLAGEEIPLVAWIVCACDAYSAITTDRPYRGARTPAEALVEMQRCAGTQFDPQVVDALSRVVGRIG